MTVGNLAMSIDQEKSYKNFIDIKDLSKSDLRWLLDKASELKHAHGIEAANTPLKGKQLAMIFEKSSTRTRVSFEVGINQLGGNALLITSEQSQIGRGEPVVDTANVLSRYCDIIMMRTFSHSTITELAENASIPVINGLTDHSHPCQIIADLQTVEEHLGNVEGKIVSWFGDVNNVLISWIEAAEIMNFELRICVPTEFSQDINFSNNVKQFTDPKQAARGTDVVVTDTWFSMGEAENNNKKFKLLEPFRVTEELTNLAKDKHIFMHCLPAHRGEEVVSEVIDGKNSVIYDEAENRLHAQKAIMLWCLGRVD